MFLLLFVEIKSKKCSFVPYTQFHQQYLFITIGTQAHHQANAFGQGVEPSQHWLQIIIIIFFFFFFHLGCLNNHGILLHGGSPPPSSILQPLVELVERLFNAPDPHDEVEDIFAGRRHDTTVSEQCNDNNALLTSI